MKSVQNSDGPQETFEVHLQDLNKIVRRAALTLFVFCLFWSLIVNQAVTQWLEIMPIPTGPNNENLSVYGPFDWIQMRWSIVILLSLVSMLPMVSIEVYNFAKSGLFPRERNWLSAVLVLTTTIVPISIVVIWVFGLPALFEFSRIAGMPEGILVRYDASSIVSLGMGITWLLIVWSVTTITLSLSRVFGMVASGKTRFRNRLLALSTGILILTLPIEYDGLKIIMAIASTITADVVSSTAPIMMKPWDANMKSDSTN